MSAPPLGSAVLWHWDVSALDPNAPWIVTEEERRLAGAIDGAERRRDHLAARSLVRTALSSCAPVDPLAWRFASGAYGKPRVAAPDCAADLRFNATHSRGLVACVVARGTDVGVDAEDLRRPVPSAGVLARALSPAELGELEASPAALRGLRFFDWWTRKEAYAKAVGAGFTLGFNRFSASDPERDGRCRFTQLVLRPNHLVTVAVLGNDAAVTVHALVPEGASANAAKLGASWLAVGWSPDA